MGARTNRRFWRICRIYFRRFRIAVWLLVLLLLGALIYLNQVGLPDFAKRPLLEKLRAQGLDLQFSRLRLSWYQGIVAEQVRFGQADARLGPQLQVAEVQVRLNWRAAAHRQLQVDSLMLRHGRITWQFDQSNPASEALTLDNIQTDLRFLPEDQWALDNFKAQFVGAKIQLSGVVTNASAVRDWAVFHGAEPASASAALWQYRLRRLADTLPRLHFAAPPELRVNVRGDALDLHTFAVLLSLSAPGAETPWGSVSRGQFAARLFPVDTNGVSHAELDLRAADAQTRWADITNFSLKVHLASVGTQTNLVRGDLSLTAGQAQTRWAAGSNALVTVQWLHSITNPIPISGQGQIRCDFVTTPWGSATQLRVSSVLSKPARTPPILDESWGFWTNLQPYDLDWEAHAANLQSSGVSADEASCGGTWRPPQLSVTNFTAQAFQGQLLARADLDVNTRAAHLNLDSDLDLHRLAPILPKESQHLLDQVSWPKPPQIKGELSVTLPVWTNRHPDWRAEVQPTVELQGELNLEAGAGYRGVQVDSLHSHFTYSNLCWHLPDLAITRADGRLYAEHRADDRTKDFYWHISSTLHPGFLRPLLDEDARRGFDLVTFSQAPVIDAEIWGRSGAAGRTGLRGQVALTNFTVRGETVSGLQTDLQYTNQSLQFFQPRIQLGGRQLRADALTVDLAAQLIYVTNGFSTADPLVVARAIGPHIARAIEPYRFLQPPVARVYGIIPLHGEESADLYFDLDGGPFHWWKFNVPHIAGQVHWSGLHLSLTNVQLEFYQGSGGGWAAFDFPRGLGTDFQFTLNATNILLQLLMADLSTRTNHLEGRLNGTLAVTKADSDSWQTVFGYGNTTLKDGLIWDIPVFGVFSPMLNGITPGLGNSRANAAACTFTITNGVIRSTDLEIRSTAMRLLYRGTVDLQEQIQARVDAELLRDVWLVGPLVSTVLWPVTKLFEYRVTGRLDDPKTQPVFIIPKIMLLPLHPIRTLKGLAPEDPNSNPNFAPLPP